MKAFKLLPSLKNRSWFVLYNNSRSEKKIISHGVPHVCDEV